MEVIQRLLELKKIDPKTNKEISAVKIYEYKKGYIINNYGNMRNKYLYLVIEGRAKIVFKSCTEKVFSKEMKVGDIIGLEFVLNNFKELHISPLTIEIIALEKSKIARLSIEDFLNEKFDGDFWKRVSSKVSHDYMKMMTITLERTIYGKKLFFLKYFERNGFGIDFPRLQDAAEVMGINFRTFQRLLKYFCEKDVLIKSKKVVEVKNIALFYEYIEKLREGREDEE